MGFACFVFLLMVEATIGDSPHKRARMESDVPGIVDQGKAEGKGEGKGKKGKPESYNLVLDSVRHEYEEVYSYQFSSADAKPVAYKAGQWGHLLAPGAEMGKGG